MGTRSLTFFIEDGKKICCLYRQFDGYPDSHGLEIAKFLRDKKIVNGYTQEDIENKNFNGIGNLAVQLISHLNENISNFHIMIPEMNDAGQEYEYEISEKDGRPFIKCSEHPSKELFKGTPEQFIKKYGPKKE